MFGGIGGVGGLSSSCSMGTIDPSDEPVSAAKGSGVSVFCTLESVGSVSIGCFCWFPVVLLV